MSATLFYLSRNPESYRKLAQEIRTTFENADEIHGAQLEYFPDPFTYNPDRWLQSGSSEDKATAQKVMREAFSAFSVGARGCADTPMAYLELSLVLAKTIWHFDFKSAAGEVGEAGVGENGEFRLYDIFTSTHHEDNFCHDCKQTMLFTIIIGIAVVVILAVSMTDVRKMFRVVLLGSRNDAPRGAAGFDPAKDIPSLADKIVMITGAAGFLGRQTAIELARYGRPACIYVADLPRDEAANFVFKTSSWTSSS
ncbi:cytochrome P450 [Seiridium cupressi]